MRPIDDINTMEPVILWGPTCGYFIGQVSMVAKEEADDYPPGTKYSFVDNDNNHRDDYPDVEQWDHLPIPSGVCIKCRQKSDNMIGFATPLGWRYSCNPSCEQREG